LPMHGGDSPRYVKEVAFDVSGTPGDLWLWGHHVGFQYFWDNFDWQQGAGDLLNEDNIPLQISSDYEAPYDGRAKAAIRINGGTWIDLTNDNVTCAHIDEESFCIGGIASATRFRVHNTAQNLQNGSNTVEFAFLGHDMLSSGYRILDMAVLPDGYAGSLSHREVLPADLITTPKSEDLNVEMPAGADASRGETLWHANNTLKDWPGGPDIIASCNDCHAQDGRDLQFFNYSNNSIKVRSMHHGLSAQDGEDIAAYIRSYDLQYEDGTSYTSEGRPWNPPYQPGPRGFGPNNEHPDVADAQHWSAGAGLEWVADNDLEAFSYIFPDGTENHDAGPFVQPPGIAFSVDQVYYDSDPTINLRELPIDVQLADWNRWLPIIHPRDAHGDDYFFNTDQAGWDYYQAARNSNGNSNDIYRFSWRSRNSYRTANPIIDPATQWNREGSRVRRGAQQWIAVKNWELHHEFYKEDTSGGSNIEPRSWVHRERAVFDIASHISGDKTVETLDGPPRKGAGDGLTHLWYHNQILLTGSRPDNTGQNSIDWNYQEMYLRAHSDNTGLPAAARITSTLIKKEEMLTGNWGLHPSHGFTNHRHGLRELHSPATSETRLASLPSDVRAGWVQTFLSAWARTVFGFDVANFPRQDTGRGIDRNYWGMPDDIPVLGGPVSFGGNNAARNHYNSVLYFANNEEVNASTLDSLARWGRTMWSDPEDGAPPWETWIIGEGAPAGGITLELTAGDTPSLAPASFTFTATPSEAVEEFTLVELYIDDVLFAELEDAPFEVAWTDVVAGTYTVEAIGYTAAGEALTSETLTIEVVEGGETQTVSLSPGWNLVSRYVEPQDTALETLWEAVGDTLVLAKNAAGASYFPEFGINDIGDWASDEAYMAYVTEAVSLNLTGVRPALEDRTTTLPAGWAYAPYRGTAAIDAAVAFASLPELLLAVGQDGGVYFPEAGINTLELLTPGRGYRVFMNERADWALPAGADSNDGFVLAASAASAPTPSLGLSPAASVLIVEAPMLPAGRTVEVATPDGTVVGRGTVDEGRTAIVINGHDAEVASSVGARAGEPLTLQVRNGTAAYAMDVDLVQDVLSGAVEPALTFEADALLHVSLGDVPSAATLYPSYPNPARTAVTVPLEVPTEGPVRLLLYDALGRQVRTLLDEPLAPGRHEVRVDVSGLASGVYHYQLRAGDARASGRMTVVR